MSTVISWSRESPGAVQRCKQGNRPDLKIVGNPGPELPAHFVSCCCPPGLRPGIKDIVDFEREDQQLLMVNWGTPAEFPVKNHLAGMLTLFIDRHRIKDLLTRDRIDPPDSVRKGPELPGRDNLAGWHFPGQ